MPYLIVTYDKPEHGRLRQQTRPEHLTFLESNKAKLLACGAKLDDLGASASGGIYIVDTEDRQEAQSFIADDPFTKAGLFERVEISRWRTAYFHFVNCLPSPKDRTLPASGLIYALQTKPPSLFELAPDGTHVKTLIANLGGRPDGVQVDATRGLIYFSMMGKPGLLDAREDFSAADGSIECCNLDGSNRRLLAGNGDIVTAKQLVLDAEGGLLYWCDREGMRVMRSRTDGREVTTLVRTGLIPKDQKDETLHCVGVAIDRERGHIYWTQKGPSDGGRCRIFRAGLELPAGASPDDRGDVELLMDNLPEPIDLDIDHGARVLYWTDRGNLTDGNTLNRACIQDSGLSEHRIVARGLQGGIGLSLDLKARRAFVADLGGTVRVIDLDEGGHDEILLHRGRLTGIAFVRPQST